MTLISHWGKKNCLFVPHVRKRFLPQQEMLTKKREIQTMMTAGMSNQKMADALGIALGTLKQRRRRMKL